MDGILLSICHDQVNLNEYRRIIRKGIPIVLFDRTIAEMDASQIKIDDYIKSFFMVEHLIRKGKTKIIHLTGPSYIQNTFERIKGYKDALSKFNIPFKEEYLVEAGVDFNSGEDAVRMLVEKNIPFDAIFCFTEMSALGAKNYLQATGGRIPQNVSIACMSGAELSKLVYPTITAVEQPVELMA